MNKTLLLGPTRFRSDKVAWVVRLGLSRAERVCKWSLLASGLVFFLVLGYAKGGYFTLEALLALVPVLTALGIRTRAKLAGGGDNAQLYDDRLVQPGGEFERLADELRPYCLEVRCQSYHYLLNTAEIHSFCRWYSVQMKPLRVAIVFALYALLVSKGWQLPAWPGLVDLRLLVYQPGTESLLFWVASVIAGLGLLSVLGSYKRGVELGSSGGVREQLSLHGADRARVLAALQERWDGCVPV